MSARYTFWRDPSGKPYKGTDGKHAPSALLAEFGTSATITNEGSLQFPGLGFSLPDSPIRSAAVILDPEGGELNIHDSSKIISNAMYAEIRRLGGGKPLLSSSVLNQADRIAAAHFRMRSQSFILLTTLSIASFPSGQISINGCKIYSRKRTKNFPFPDAIKQFNHRAEYQEHVAEKTYLPMRIRTQGRTTFEAANKAFTSINLLRALWTLFATYGSWTKSFGVKTNPVGVIHLGPLSSLHQTSGKIAEDAIWYSNPVGNLKVFQPKNGWASLEKVRRWALRKIRSLAYQNEMVELLIRYVGALDQSNYDLVLLHLWGVLEKLTDTVGQNYDETIKRASWFYENRRKAIEELESLRLSRNQLVHSARSDLEGESRIYALKSFVDNHLVRMIRNDFQIGCFEHYGKHLAMPTNMAELIEQKKRLTRCITIIRESQQNS